MLGSGKVLFLCFVFQLRLSLSYLPWNLVGCSLGSTGDGLSRAILIY